MLRWLTIALMLCTARVDADTCDQRMTKLAERMTPLVPYSLKGTPTIPNEIVVERASPIDIGGWAISVLASGEVRVEGAPPGGSIAKQVERYKLRLTEREIAEREGMPTYLAVEPDTRASLVAKVVTEARAAGLGKELRLLVRIPPPPAAKTDPALFARPGVAALRETAAKSTEYWTFPLGRAMKDAVQPCAPAIKILGGIDVDAKLLTTVPAAAQDCQCKMRDLDVFEYVLLAYEHAFEARDGWVAMPALDAKDKRTMAEVLKRP